MVDDEPPTADVYTFELSRPRIDENVDGTSLSGTATIPAGASVSVSVNHGPALPRSSTPP